MNDPALWSCGTLGKVHGLMGEMYLNLAPGGLERLELGERFFVADEGAGEPRACSRVRAGRTDALSSCWTSPRPARLPSRCRGTNSSPRATRWTVSRTTASATCSGCPCGPPPAA